jgi:uncharacterized protein
MRKTIVAGLLMIMPLCGQPMLADDAAPPADTPTTNPADMPADNPTDAPTTNPSDPAKISDIHKLLQLSGAGKLGTQVAAQMIPALQKAIPNVPQEFWTEFQKDIHPDELEDLIVPIYDKHFSHEEIRQLIEFYKSSIGKKLAGELPAISKESMEAGEKWGQQIALKAIKEAQARQQAPAN